MVTVSGKVTERWRRKTRGANADLDCYASQLPDTRVVFNTLTRAPARVSFSNTIARMA